MRWRVDVLQRDRGKDARSRRTSRDEARGEQRMAAEIGEEIRVEGDRPRRQHALGGVEQHRLGRGARLLLLLRVDRGAVSATLFSALRSILPEERRGRAVDHLETRRNHVGGQRTRAASRAQFARGRARPPSSPTRKATSCVQPILVAQHDGRLANMRRGRDERGLDLAQLDAEAADLHLIVDAAAEDGGRRSRRAPPRRRSDRGSDRSRRSENGLAMNFSAVSSARRR